MKTIFFVLLINILVNSAVADEQPQFTNSTEYGFSYDYYQPNISNYTTETAPSEIQLHFIPDFLTVTGSAQVNIPNEQVKISVTIQTIKTEASESLKVNNNKINVALNNLQLIGLKKSEFSSSGTGIQGSYPTVYNPSNNTYTQVFQGYLVKNSVVVTTKNVDLAGQIIDITTSGGLNNIDYVNYTPLDSTIQQSKQKLLALATNNAARNANTVLTELGYEVKAVKSVSLNSYDQNSPMYDFSWLSNSTDASLNSTLNGYTNLQAFVTVNFIIGKKLDYLSSE